MKSHIYPKAILKKWFINFMKSYPELKKLFILDPENGDLVTEKIDNIEALEKVLEKYNSFYLNLSNSEYSKEIEKKWNQDIENIFFQKIDQSLFKIIKNQLYINFSFMKQVNNLFATQTEKIINFFSLNLLRSLFLINKKVKSIDHKGNVVIEDFSEMITEINLKEERESFDDAFEEIKKILSTEKYEILLFPVVMDTLFEPPIFMKKIKSEIEFIAIPISSGLLFLIKKNFRFVFNELTSHFEFKKIEDNEIKKDLCWSFPIIFDWKKICLNHISNHFYNFLFYIWFYTYGDKIGRIFTFNPCIINDKELISDMINKRKKYNLFLKSSENKKFVKHIKVMKINTV